MLRLVVASGFLMATFSSAVSAADYAPPPVLRGALPGNEKSIDWSGFYIGGSGAYSNVNTGFSGNTGATDPTLEKLVKGTVVSSGIARMPLIERGKPQNSDIGFGLYAGYNWAADDYIFGVEADYNRGKLEGGSKGQRSGRIGGNVSDTQYDWNANTDKSYKISDYGSFRARMGYAWDNWMPYVTAGVAYARASTTNAASVSSYQVSYNSSSAIISQGNTVYTPSSFQDSNRAKFFFGYALGAGLDVAITSNLILRAEIQHLRFTDVASSGVQLNQAKVGAALKF